MDYFYSIKDDNGYIHSIDNCIVIYSLYSSTYIKLFMDYLHVLRDKYNLDSEYWERLNCAACSHWSWFTNHVHLCNGVYLSIGKYNALNVKDDKLIVPVVKLEINLNKHHDKPCYIELNKWLIDNSGEITLNKYDYAIDIPANIKDVKVFGSNKERGLYKGTRYYGQRNKNGYCKIYDKQKEQNLEYSLTRVEHTISPDNNKYKNLSLENVYIKSNNKDIEISMNDTDKCIISMIKSLEVYGENTEQYIDMLGRKKKARILTLLNGYKYEKLIYNKDILTDLLQHIKDLIQFQEIKTKTFVDKNGFMQIDDVSLPFD